MRGLFCLPPPLLAVLWLVVASAVTPGSGQQASARLPVPEPAAVQEALKLLREVYGDERDQAKTSSQKIALAKELFDQAAKTTGAPVDRFVLLKVAQDVAAGGADAATALKGVDIMAEAFEIDGLEVKLKLLATISKTARLSPQRKALAASAADLIDEAVARDDYDIAEQLARIALAAARRARDVALVRRISDWNKRLEKSKKAYAAVRDALVALEKSPTDPDANQAVGSYFCLDKGDWETGIPMLALGANPVLQALAEKELKGVNSPEEQIALGDGWWDLAEKEKGPTRTKLQLRAGVWYKQALPGSSGLRKVKVQQRLEEIAALGTSTDPQPGQAKKPKTDRWLVLFRSADPSIWNRDIDEGKNRFAIPVAKAPVDMKYLKLGIRPDAFIIIELSKDKLLKYHSGPTTWAWNGTLEHRADARHLGIYNKAWYVKEKTGAIFVMFDVNYAGWGFGHVGMINGRQGYAWAGQRIPPTVFEISVTAENLSRRETQHLLGSTSNSSGATSGPVGAPAAPKVKLRVVCDVLAAKAGPKGLAFDAVAFTSPRGNGRRGANGFVVPAHPEWQTRGTIWNCEYRRGGSARGVQFIHPFRNGHVIVTARSNQLAVTSPGTWPDFGYTPRGPTLPLVTTANFSHMFQLHEAPRRLTSVLLPNGVFRFYLDGQLVATGMVPDARPLVLAPNFQGPEPLPQVPPGHGGAIIGPRDNGVNEAKNLSFGPT